MAHGSIEAGTSENEREGRPGDFCQHSVLIPTPWGPTSCAYLLSVPEDDADGASHGNQEAWPVMVFLTGKAEIRNADKVKDWIGGKEGMHRSARAHSIVIVPLIREDSALFQDRNRINVDALWLLLRTAIAQLGNVVDHQRISLTGYSLGADAALQIALRYGTCVAAVALFCGQYSYLSQEIEDEAAEQLSHVAVKAFHALSDNYVPASCTETMFSWLCARWSLDANECERRVEEVPDPDPPEWDPSAKAKFDVMEAGSARSMWLVQDYVYVSEDSWNGWRKKRKHVFWPMVYLNEEIFGLFKWLRSHRSSSQASEHLRFRVLLERTSICCSSKTCPAAQLGFSTSRCTSANTADGSTPLLIGPGFHLDGPGSPLRRWNRLKFMQGQHELKLLAGDEILSVNDVEDLVAMETEILEPSKKSLDLLVLRRFSMGQGQLCDHASLGSLHTPQQKRLKTSTDAATFVVEMQRRGAFNWVLHEGEALDLQSLAAQSLSDAEIGTLSRKSNLEKLNWLSSWKRCQWLCTKFLALEFAALRTTLQPKLHVAFQDLLNEPISQLEKGQTAYAWWCLRTVELAQRAAVRHWLLLPLLCKRTREAVTGFLGSPVALEVPPATMKDVLEGFSCLATFLDNGGRAVAGWHHVSPAEVHETLLNAVRGKLNS